MNFHRLSDFAGRSISVGTAGSYRIQVPNTDFLVLAVPHVVDSPASEFSHPNVLARVFKTLDYVRYTPKGGKYFVQKPSVIYYFAIPADKVEIAEKEGCSYVETRINGAAVVLNCSGGTEAGGGWRDFFRENVEVVGGKALPLRAMKKIAEVAVPLESLLAHGWTKSTREPALCDRLNFHGKIAELRVGKVLSEGMTIVLSDSIYYIGGSRGVVTNITEGKSSITAQINGRCYVVKRSQINWTETTAANGMAIGDFDMTEVEFTPPARTTEETDA